MEEEPNTNTSLIENLPTLTTPTQENTPGETRSQKRRSTINEGMLTLKMQNEALKLCKSMKIRKFKQKECEIDTIGGNVIRTRAWISDEILPKSGIKIEKSNKKLNTNNSEYICTVCDKVYNERKSLSRHKKTHKIEE